MAAAIRVLYVDDESALLELGKVFLEKSGDFTVTTATSAPDAIRLLEKEGFDVIVSDYQMPGMDGIQFLVLVRTKFGQIPFILFTGKGREEVVIQAINAGADFYLQKGGEPKSQFAELSHKIISAASRKRADDALRESEEKYHNVIEDQTEFISRFLPDGTHIFVNDAYCRYFGVAREDILGHRFKPVLYEDDRKAVAAFFAKLTLKNPVGTIDHRIIMPDGSTHWQRWSDRAIFDDDGKLVQYQSVGRDITGQKDAEIAIKRSKAQLTAIIQSSPIPKFVINKDHRVIHWNKALEGYSGIKEKEIIGTNQHWRAFYKEERPCMADLVLDGSVEKFPQWYAGKYAKSKLIEGAYEATDFFPDMGITGTWLYFTASIIKDDDGKILGAIETLEDSTETHLKTEELNIAYQKIQTAFDLVKESEEQYRNIVEDQTEFISRFLPDGTHIFVNDAYCRYFGVSREVIIGQRFRPVIHSDDREAVSGFFATLTLKNPVGTIDHRIIMPDGSIRWQRWSDRAVFNADGRVVQYQSVGRDITGRKRLEEALAESEERFRMLLQHVPSIAIQGYNMEGITQYWNDASEKLYGYTSEEAIGKNLIDLIIPPEMKGHVREAITYMIETGQPIPASEVVLMRKDRSRIDVYSHHALIKNPKSGMELFCIDIDISERKKAEEALRESTIRLDELAEQNNTVVWEVDSQGLYIYVSHMSEAVWGYRPDELVGRLHFYDLQPEPGREAFKAASFAVFERKEPFLNLENVIQTKDGREVWASTNGIPMLNADGTLRGYRGSDTDITERKRADDEIKRISFAIDATSDAIGMTTADGHHFYQNAAFERIFGYTVEEVSHLEPARMYVNEGDVRKVFETIKTGKSWYGEIDMIAKNGRRFPVSLRADAVRDKNGKIIGLIGVHTDITERKRAEEALITFSEDLECQVNERTSDLTDVNLKLMTEVDIRIEAEKQLTKSVGEKEVLLREVHHRVKNNLQIIISLLNLQSRYIEEEKTQQVIKDSQNRVRAMSLVHEKLYQSTDITKIDLDNYIRYLGNGLFKSYGITGKGNVIRTRIQDINVDINTAIPVGLIINELISNSLKYAFPDGRTEEITIAMQRENAMLTITYKDNGVGIPEDFDWRNAESLGLRLVILLVEQLDGTIELDRTGGTTFTIVVKEMD